MGTGFDFSLPGSYSFMVAASSFHICYYENAG